MRRLFCKSVFFARWKTLRRNINIAFDRRKCLEIHLGKFICVTRSKIEVKLVLILSVFLLEISYKKSNNASYYLFLQDR